MGATTYRYRFNKDIPPQELEDTFMLALVTLESLHGHSRVRLESQFCMESTKHRCAINGHTQIGSDLARIFIGLAIREFGEKAVCVQPEDTPPHTAAQGEQ